ncbi:CAP domain-containing protein [Paenibacillaceae bacterium WGS1546]|uniref:CAP domain-containing protein n=1 Tax=Cohnella sp. WGS1546 TaxID=3366810 RepID=UPI00372D797E
MKRAAVLVCIVLLAACATRGPGMNQATKQRDEMKSKVRISAIDTKTPVNRFVVKNNESLQDIADRFHVDIGDLIRENPDLGWLVGRNPSPEQGRPGRPEGDVTAPLPNDREVHIPSEESMTGYELEVLKLTNAEREKAGLAPCAGDETSLNRSARAKSQDMATNNYFSHDSPTYGDPFAMMRSFGVQYRSAGENIAKGQPTPQEVVQAWMNSPGHRANILNGAYTHLGVGYVANNGQPCWTQQFIAK